MSQDAKCRCHQTPISELSGKHIVQGVDGALLAGLWEPKVTCDEATKMKGVTYAQLQLGICTQCLFQVSAQMMHVYQ